MNGERSSSLSAFLPHQATMNTRAAVLRIKRLEMVPLSVVIITKNEAGDIGRCIKKAKLITDDVVVVDSGSTDNTRQIAQLAGARLFERPWDGYGANKNKGIALAKYDWILSLDADELPDDTLVTGLHALDFDDPRSVYDIRFRSYFGQKLIRFGSWGRDHHIRLFNRTQAKWTETLVHETLLLPANTTVLKLKGHIEHHSVKDTGDYERKSTHYAKLCARQHFKNGKRAGFIKLYLSALFGFVKNYFFRLGLLDGREGWLIAIVTQKNTRLKYKLLNQMEAHPQPKEASIESKVLSLES